MYLCALPTQIALTSSSNTEKIERPPFDDSLASLRTPNHTPKADMNVRPAFDDMRQAILI